MSGRETNTCEILIGLEVHARLQTRSKAFCGCANDAAAETNSLLCPVCMGLPGTLPVVNVGVVELAVRAGLALSATVHRCSVFARKMYSYPDLPKGYQITQHEQPICTGGALRYRGADGVIRDLSLWRLHIEEDAAKLSHSNDATLVDYNRCGAPLLEIVTAPGLACVDDAIEAAKELRRILIALEVCDGHMERGSFRCDVNVSVSRQNREGARTEIKNLNSFSAIRQALRWEIDRQCGVTDSDSDSVVGPTLHWDPVSGEGSIMRAKEAAHEYRYSVEPDLPVLEVTEEILTESRCRLCELPLEREQRFINSYGLSAYDSAVLCSEGEMAAYFEELMTLCDASRPFNVKLAVNWVSGEVLRHTHALGLRPGAFPLRPDALAELLGMIASDALDNTSAKAVLEAMVTTGQRAGQAANELGLLNPLDMASLDSLIAEMLLRHAERAESWREGNTKMFGYFMGQLMRASGGRINPAHAARRLQDALRCDAQSKQQQEEVE